ncbi:unnamed protein product [Gongylonema pulchrum]|uniref:Peptidase A1 domain-containing protein n=1 Tax=Gongylonema pulchrum TaxID=637853 RepID=A0A183DYH0_9BILA|nr:unnamed protein product [Gongylonema pulchrum]
MMPCALAIYKRNFPELQKPRSGACGGQFTYGGFDSEHCGDIMGYTTLSSAAYWQFSLRQIGTTGYACSFSAEAISDTGSSFIGGPPSVVEALAVALGGEVRIVNIGQVHTWKCCKDKM